MSLHILNDENVPSEKSSESYDFLFSQPELTGRSSVLRLSQKENVPPRNQARATKVSVDYNVCTLQVLWDWLSENLKL